MIYLHIGRNKAGSTTLQDFFLENREVLERNGIRYALYGHLKDSVPGVLGFGSQAELAAYARAHPDIDILISHEWMFHWEAIYIEIMGAELRDLPVKVIAYIRPYPSWVCSNYAQDIRIGESKENFDAYFESFHGKVSVWPDLQLWAEQVGWSNIIVRLIDRRNTSWDELAGDFLAAIERDPKLGTQVPASNQGPGWAITELLRALGGMDATQSVANVLQNLLRECLDANSGTIPEAQYLTPAQNLDLVELYNRDIAHIKAYIGGGLVPEPIAAIPERSFLPQFSRLPPDVLREFEARANAPEFVANHPLAAAAARGLFIKSQLKRPGIAAAIQRALLRR